MDYGELKSSLEGLYRSGEGEYISTGLCLNGEGFGIYISLEEDKYTRLYTNEAFALWFENVYVIEREQYMPYVDAICKRYGVIWNEKEKHLYVRFRRNELTLSEGVTRLHAAAMLCASLGHDLFV